MDQPQPGVDLSPLHRELDHLKAQLCRCNHQGECLACQGFEVLRQQSQMVAAAASQPVLMQVAQEAAVKDLMAQLGGVSDKLSGDTRLQELLGQLVERVQEDLGGPEELRRMLGGLPGFDISSLPGFGPAPGGSGAEPAAGGGERPRRPYDDIPPEERGESGAPPGPGAAPPPPNTGPEAAPPPPPAEGPGSSPPPPVEGPGPSPPYAPG